MTYEQWSSEFHQRRQAIEDKLSHLSIPDLVDYFDFDNMVDAEPQYCGLYTTRTKCHNTDSLNCYFCGCPYFIVHPTPIPQSDGTLLHSSCQIDAIKGTTHTHDGNTHQDCSNCDIPHRATFAKRLLHTQTTTKDQS